MQNLLRSNVARTSCPCFMGGTPMPREVLQEPLKTKLSVHNGRLYETGVTIYDSGLYGGACRARFFQFFFCGERAEFEIEGALFSGREPMQQAATFIGLAALHTAITCTRALYHTEKNTL